MSEETIFATALEKPADARAAYLAEACGNDEALRKRLEGLLAASDKLGNFMANPAVAPAADPAATQSLSDANDGLPAGRESTPTDVEALTFLAPPARPDSLGLIGHYEVLQILGRGGFGIVFRAFDEMLQRVVALKVMAPQLAATSPARKRFLREARSSAQVRHENVVQVYEVAEQPLPYLAMEFIPGETLQQKLDRVGPLDVPETLRIGRQIAEGLAAAHATDLIHRDIKPGNVLLEGGQHKVKITDFGLARAADDASISQSGLIAGTPMYMAPEQAQGQPLDQRADLFSLGSVLYQMVAGRPPFRASSAVAVLKRVAEDQPRAIREIIPETPQWLCDIIAKLHAKNPDDRYQSAREVADVLADCEAQLKTNSKLKDYSRIPRSQPRRSGRWKWAAVAAAVLLPVIALGVTESAGVTHLFRGRQPPATVTSKDDPHADPKVTKSQGRFSLAFDGKSSWVQIPSLRINEDHALTVETWVVLEQPFDQRKTYDLMSTTARSGFGLGGYDDGSRNRMAFLIRLKKPDNYVGAWEKQPVPRHQLIHLAGVYDGKAELRFYVNGQLQSRTLVQAIKPSPRYLTIGGNERGTSLFLGRMFEVRISKVARYGNDFTPAKRFEADGGTIALYRFDEGEGTVLNDSSGNGHNGQIIGAKWVKADESPIGPPPAAKTLPLAVAPFTDADVKRIAALPAAEQVEEVRKELMRRNPGFDGKFEHKIKDGVVTEFRIVTDQVTDIAPIRVFKALRVLQCNGTWTNKRNGQLANLTPLEGMNLAGLRHVDLMNTEVSDAGMVYFKNCTNLTALALGCSRVSDAGLSHFKDCKALTNLSLFLTNVGDAGLVHFRDCKDLMTLDLAVTKVSDIGLAHFKNCKNLMDLRLGNTQVGDAGLAHFKGVPLKVLWIDHTGVTDLTPLQGMPLEDIRLTPKNITRGLDILRDMKSLKTIGVDWNQSWPAAEFWERYQKGEFK